MKIVLSIIAFIAVIGVAGVLFLIFSGPKKSDFEHLVEPKITDKPSVKSIMVDFNGDADIVIKAAFTSLFKVYYGLKGVPKGPGQPAPVARYGEFDALLENATEEELKSVPWRGYVAIPVPDSVSSLPEKSVEGYPVRVETLEYGTVAEIIHFGPYKEEMPAIDKLKRYITDSGYEIAGMHEEEYVKGPGMPFSHPSRYITIIRYQVKKK